MLIMPRYDYKEEFGGRRVEESDSDANSYDSDEYLAVTVYRKRKSQVLDHLKYTFPALQVTWLDSPSGHLVVTRRGW